MTDARLLSCQNLDVRVPGRSLVEALSLELVAGEFVAVLGQNGAGKTLSLMTLAGLRPADSGTVLFGGQPIDSVDRKQVALQLALLPQDVDDVFPASVLDTALIGRHPHIHGLRWESTKDVDVTRTALAQVDLDDFASRDVLTLSGGERRRVSIAQALAQQPDVYLLDEPTNHLDPQHQIQTMRLFRQAADDGAAVLASLHDVNLAVRFADRCLLLYGDGRWELGPAAEVLTEARLSDLFATPMQAVDWHSKQLFVAVDAP